MKYLVVFVLLLSMVLTGCANTKVYTFKKDRVDQEREGNRGYMLGTPPPAPDRAETPQRTMFGLDIEVDYLPGEGKDAPQRETVVYEEEDVYVEEAPAPQTTNFEPKTEEPAPIEKRSTPDEWVK